MASPKANVLSPGLKLTGQAEHGLHMLDAAKREWITSSQCLPPQAY